MSTKLPPNTHSDEELKSPEFRAGVERMKNAIRTVVVRAGLADERLDNVATVWTALHEFARELLLTDKDEVQAEAYWTKVLEFAEWQFEHEGYPLTEEQKQRGNAN